MPTENTTPGRSYELPASSNKLSDDVIRLIAAIMQVDADMVAVLTAISGKAPSVHTHAMSDINGLTAALGDKAAATHTHPLSALTGVSLSSPATAQVLRYSGAAWQNATLTPADIMGLATTLSSLSNALTTLTARVDTIDGGTF